MSQSKTSKRSTLKHKSSNSKNHSRTVSQSRVYDSKQKKWVFTNRLRQQEQHQKNEINKLNKINANFLKKYPNYVKNKYIPNQFVGLQAANQTRRTKPTRTAFRGTKYRAIFHQFNKHRT